MESSIPNGAPQSSFIKQLASCNATLRRKALQSLCSWLPPQEQVSDGDLKKIWKGLFYCFWHSDKAAAQAELAETLSSLLLLLRRSVAADYFSAFLLTIHREWSGIDALRLDKFYLLIRRFVRQCFLFLKNSSWDLGVSRQFIGVLEERTFLAEGKFPGNGVSYHVASVFLEELMPFLPVRAEIVELMFLPFVAAMGRSSDKVLLGKIKSSVFDVLVKTGRDFLEARKSGDEIDATCETAAFGTIAFSVKFATLFYDLGSSKGCVQGNRKVLLSLHEKFLELEKDLEKSGIEISISIPEVVNDGGEEEVPNLVPISMDLEGGDSDRALVNGSGAKKKQKKKKKAKKGLDGSGKHAKVKEELSSDLVENREEMEASANSVVANGEESNEEAGNIGNDVVFDDITISNLQMQFEKVAAESGLDIDGANVCKTPDITANSHVTKKRKRVKVLGGKDARGMDSTSEGQAAGAKSNAKSVKKVKFSMKSNLVWKPHSPLPPENLRLPPSVTPRGSALKKGVPPGPIREMASVTKKSKAKGKKGLRGLKSISPAVKRLKKLKSVTNSI